MSNARNIASGSKFVDTAGDNITGSLGINNATPSFPLHIKGSTNTNAILGVESANWTAGATAELRLAYTAGYNRSIKGHHDNGLQFFTNPTNPSLQIDNSGRVTMPNQPSFYAYTSSDYTDTGALTGGSKWGEKWDTGNNFSDGTFTAPVAGKYYFEVMWDANGIQSTIDIQVNTTSQVRYEPTGRTDSTWETHSYNALLNLAANDSVRLYGNKHSGTSSYPYHMGGSGQWGHFAGFLIG